jgi:hypothetical protein
MGVSHGAWQVGMRGSSRWVLWVGVECGVDLAAVANIAATAAFAPIAVTRNWGRVPTPRVTGTWTARSDSELLYPSLTVM